MFKSRLLIAGFFLLYLAVVVKLGILTVLQPKLSLEDIYLKDKKIMPERGKIYDRNGEPLVINKPAYDLYFDPKKITDEEESVRRLDAILKIGEATLSARIDKTKQWVAVVRNLDKQTHDKIIQLKLTGVGFEDSLVRSYPEASLAAHVLGFVGKDYWGDNLGYFGVEGFYNKDLAGLPGVYRSERDLLGRPILIGTQERIEPENGRDLYLTIDNSVQVIAKKKLANGLTRYQAKEGCVIVADPNSMAILASVCLPDYDPEKYYSFSENFFKNPAVSNLYEPGSIFKPLVMAAAIEEKSVNPTDFYEEDGPVKIGEYTIKTWNDKYEGKISMTRIIEKSSNVGMVWIGSKLGSKKLYSYLKKYGFSQATGVDLEGEVSGYLKPASGWYPIDFATATFGQGIAITPLQMLRAFAAIINGGKLYQPYVVSRMVGGSESKQILPKFEGRVISDYSSLVIKKMLLSAVDNGEVRWAKPKGYEIGGKTGTAQIAIAGHYDPAKTIASFIGFAPIDKPKFIVLVILREPKTSPWGSETAAPLFFEIARELLVYYNIAPEQ